MPWKNSGYLLHITIPVLIAVISFFIVSDWTVSTARTDGIISSIEESREDALKLAASSTAVSVAITALPDDIGTPVANTLAELNKGFLLVLCALYLEKFLVSVTGIIAFKWLVPLACAVYTAGYITKRRAVRLFSWKLLCFAFVIYLAIPMGCGISDMIRERYGETMRQTIESAENSAGLMKEGVAEGGADEEAGNGLGKILKNLQKAGDTIAKGTSQFMKYLEKLVSRFIEAVAMMIVTSCVIPLLVVLGLVWISKMIFMTEPVNTLKLPDADRIREKLTDRKNGEERETAENHE